MPPTIDPADVQRYRDRAAEFDRLLADLDDRASGLSRGRLARVLFDALRVADAELARFDPRYGEVAGRCVTAVWRQNHRSSWAADTIGRTVIRVATTHEHGGRLYKSVCDTRDLMWGARRRTPGSRRRLARAEAAARRVDADPGATGHAKLAGVEEVARRLLGCGRYAEAMATFDRLILAYPDAGLRETPAVVLALSLSAALEEFGEPERTADLLTAYDRAYRQDDGGTASPDHLAMTVSLELRRGRCLTAARRSAAATECLGTALGTLERRREAWTDPEIHGLVHRITHELGSALWQHGRREQAAHRFVAALDLLWEEGADVQDATWNRYRNAVLYSRL